MIADVYRTRKTNVFLLVPSGASLDGVPRQTFSELGHPIFLSTRELDDPLLTVDTVGINAELAAQGFSVRET
jgi:uncharacterized protein YcgL (UPF0745 family)